MKSVVGNLLLVTASCGVGAFAPFSQAAQLTTQEVIPLLVSARELNPMSTRSQLGAELLAHALITSHKVLAESANRAEVWRAAATNRLPESEKDFQSAVDTTTFSALLNVYIANPANPAIVRKEVPEHHIGNITIPSTITFINNPDTIYRVAQLDGRYQYVISGKMALHRGVDLSFSVQSPDWRTVSAPLGNDLKVDADGNFEIHLDRSAAQPGVNHLLLPNGAAWLTIRDTLIAAAIQRPMQLRLRRIDGPPDTAMPPYEELEKLAVAEVDRAFDIALSVEKLISSEHVNQISQPQVRSYGGFLATQANNITHLQIPAGKAFVVTVRLGGAKYFSLPVCDRWQSQVDFVSHQVGLNHGQAARNGDGTYTFVISATDPGAYNWIDTVGRQEVIAQFRWQGLPTMSPSEGGPAIVTQKLVDLADLKSVMPPETRMLSKLERREQLDKRQEAMKWMH